MCKAPIVDSCPQDGGRKECLRFLSTGGMRQGRKRQLT